MDSLQPDLDVACRAALNASLGVIETTGMRPGVERKQGGKEPWVLKTTRV
jgi:hypothetical protein